MAARKAKKALTVNEAALVHVPKGIPEADRGIAARVAAVANHYMTIVEAAGHAFDDPAQIAQLDARTRMIAQSALMPKKEVPFALEMAASFAKESLKLSMESGKKPINVNIGSVNVPPMAKVPTDQEVVVVEEKRR